MSDVKHTPSVDEARDAWTAAEKAAAEAKKAYHAAMIAASPYKVGDVIRSKKGELAKVVRMFVRYDFEREPQIAAVLKKKDGSWGTRETAMWRNEWERPEVVGHEAEAQP